MRNGDASVQILAGWQKQDDGSYDDPTLGKATSNVLISASETTLLDTAALGRPENLDLVRALGLEPGLVRADLVAAAIRKVDGIQFYDFDLALPARTCDAELATACLPSLVVLLSCGIRAGKLHVVRVDATADQWKRAGTALRLLRTSFKVDG